MAPRNKPSAVLKRDSAFTQAIGKPATGKPNPFATVAQGLTAKLDAARPTDASDPIVADAPPTPEKDEPVTPAAEPGASGTRSDPSPAPDLPDIAKDAAPAAAASNVKRAGAAGQQAEVIITMRIETDLMERAENWAAALALPVSAIIRKSLNRMMPQLVAELKTLKAADVQVNRAESVGYRLQTRVRLDPEELAELEARLDPAGFGVTNSLLNFHTRNRFTTFLDKLMRDAGY